MASDQYSMKILGTCYKARLYKVMYLNIIC